MCLSTAISMNAFRAYMSSLSVYYYIIITDRVIVSLLWQYRVYATKEGVIANIGVQGQIGDK